MTYDNFVGFELAEAVARFQKGHDGRAPSISELAHFAWQRLVDHREYENWLQQCELHGIRDIPWVTEGQEPSKPPPSTGDWRPEPSLVRLVTGDFLDALHEFARPTFMLPGMSEAEQLDVIAKYPGTHMPFGWKTSYSKFPQWAFDHTHNFGEYEKTIDRCFAYKKVPVCAIHFEAEDTRSAHVARIRPWLKRLLAADRLVCVQWGWEINDINDWTADGDEQLEYIRGLRNIVPLEIPLYVHWTPERWSGWPSFHNTVGNPEDEGGELDWLREARKLGVTGVFYQEPFDKPVPALLERALYLDKKNYVGPGICGRVHTADLDFVMYEHSRHPDHFKEVVRAVIQDGRATVYC